MCPNDRVTPSLQGLSSSLGMARLRSPPISIAAEIEDISATTPVERMVCILGVFFFFLLFWYCCQKGICMSDQKSLYKRIGPTGSRTWSVLLSFCFSMSIPHTYSCVLLNLDPSSIIPSHFQISRHLLLLIDFAPCPPQAHPDHPSQSRQKWPPRPRSFSRNVLEHGQPVHISTPNHWPSVLHNSQLDL